MIGMEMMLKSMGFDPAQFQGFITGMQNALQKFNADLETIKTNQQTIIQNQNAILAAVVKPTFQESENG